MLNYGPSKTVIKLNSKPEWVRLPEGDKEIYEDYGSLSLAEWHKKAGVYVE